MKTIEEQVIDALQPGPLHKREIAGAIGLSELQAFAVIKRLREIGIIRLTGDRRYEIGHGGYSPDGGRAA